MAPRQQPARMRGPLYGGYAGGYEPQFHGAPQQYHQQPPASFNGGAASPFGSPAPPPGRGAAAGAQEPPWAATRNFPPDKLCDTCGGLGHGHRRCQAGLPHNWFRQQQQALHGFGAKAGAGGPPQQLQLMSAPPRG
jgi:hypothetical protein